MQGKTHPERSSRVSRPRNPGLPSGVVRTHEAKVKMCVRGASLEDLKTARWKQVVEMRN
jgi:hypothetical protein